MTRTSLRKHAITAVGLAFYCIGLLAPLIPATGHIALPARVAGVVLLGFAAWRQRSLTGWIFGP